VQFGLPVHRTVTVQPRYANTFRLRCDLLAARRVTWKVVWVAQTLAFAAKFALLHGTEFAGVPCTVVRFGGKRRWFRRPHTFGL
jgi:hypothetical protein